MRPLLILAAAAPLFAAQLSVLRPAISDSDGGAPFPVSFEHVPGEILFFSCRVAGFQKTSDEQMHLAYTVEAFDPHGVPIQEAVRNEIREEVTPQDKDWMPKIETEVPVPPLALSGSYKIVVTVEDLVAKSKTQLATPFTVQGRDVAPSDTLTVRNFHFYRSEDEARPLEKPVYRPGDSVWARFDITGFKYGPKNKTDVSYVTSVIAGSGKVLWTQPQAAGENSESFYPKPYVPASMGINLQKNIAPGEYTIAVEAKDAVGNQIYETKETFQVE
ncbi:MAG TPA: hypothetical protein VJ732_19620 [Bryobacteraceae bacterium]|nr:hypothetical protein [Bryobacteraceae bacterium]